MQKAIEEMAKIVCKACDFICDCEYLMKDKKAYTWCDLPKEVCEELYNAGYRKVDEKFVVIEKSFLDEHYIVNKEFVEDVLKEKTREILQILEFLKGSVLRNYGVAETVGLDIAIRKIKEKYGVEVE